MTAHIHAALMLQYAQDASTTEKPWEMWEFRCDEHEKWTILTGNPAWDDDTKYRRKPRTIRIGEIEIPEPVREPLQNGEQYFVPAIDCGDYHANSFSWDNDSTDKRLLKQGVVHLTEGAAAATLREALEEVPKSVRKPLTDKEIQDVWCSAKDEGSQHGPFWFARAIEKAHGIK